MALEYNCYSLLNASIGFKFAALLAGIYPKNRPIATDTPKEISTAARVGVAENPIMVPTTFVAAQPIRWLLHRLRNWSQLLQ